MAYLLIYPPDVDCNTDDKIFIRFKLFPMPTSITDNVYDVRVWITNDADDERLIRCGNNLAPGDYTTRGKAILWDRTIDGVRQSSGDYQVRVELLDYLAVLVETTGYIKFTIN